MIVTSTALIKSRIGNAKQIVDNLMSGSLIPDKIYFFISEEPHNIDKGIKPHEVPIIDNPKVEFIYTENIGSLRKIVPILKMYWSRDSTRIILFDDDFKIMPDTIGKLANYTQNINHRFHACGISGNIYTDGKPKTQLERAVGRSIEFGWVLRQPKQVDLLSSGLGLMVKPKFFDGDILNWKNYVEEYGVNITDEHFVNYMLAKKGTPRFVVPVNRCPPPLPATEVLSYAKNCPRYKHIQSKAWHNKIREWRM